MVYNKKLIYIVLTLLFILTCLASVVYAEDTKGSASWYGDAFHGKKTASGETFNMYSYTAAHRTYEFGTKLKVTNVESGDSVIVKVNDRGPYVGSRIIDLSKKAFSEIAQLDEGVIEVKIEKISDGVHEDSIEDISAPLNIEDSNLTVEDDVDPKEVYYYRLQFGAFSNRDYAIEFAKELVKLNLKIKIYKVKYKNGKTLYKVISDEKFKSISLANSSADDYKLMGLDCFLIQLNF